MAVEYFESPLLPGKPMFRCDRMLATLQVASCVGMWREANGRASPPESSVRCRQCPIGAGHAGVVDGSMSPLRGTTMCSRCHRTDLRLIGGNLCVGCKNREYEWVKGANAKGKPPVRHPALARRALRVLRDGRVTVVVRELTASPMELIVEVLRDSVKQPVFGLGRIGVWNES